MLRWESEEEILQSHCSGHQQFAQRSSATSCWLAQLEKVTNFLSRRPKQKLIDFSKIMQKNLLTFD